MAGIITISDEKRWEVSNWAYWNLMDHVLGLLITASHAARFVETCKWMQGLDISLMQQDEPELAGPVLLALKRAAQSCSEGSVPAKVDDRVLDEEAQRQFREATNQLFTMLSGLP